MHQHQYQTPAEQDAAVRAVLARFLHGMPEPGQVTIDQIAAHFHVSWIAAAGMIARARQAQEEA